MSRTPVLSMWQKAANGVKSRIGEYLERQLVVKELSKVETA